jgi:hypothetical protein
LQSLNHVIKLIMRQGVTPAHDESGAATDEGAQPRVGGASTVSPNPLTEKQQPPHTAWGLKPTKQAPALWGRGLSLGPLDIAATPQRRLQGEGAVRPNLKPINEPPVQQRRGINFGPLEIHRRISSKPSTTAAVRVKPFPNRLSFVREEG